MNVTSNNLYVSENTNSNDILNDSINVLADFTRRNSDKLLVNVNSKERKSLFTTLAIWEGPIQFLTPQGKYSPNPMRSWWK